MKAIQKTKSNLLKIIIVLRHGILSLYSYIRKFVPWRSRTYIQNLRHVRIAGVTSSFLFGLLALAIIIPLYNVSGTEDTEAATGTAIDSSITFTSTRNAATVDLTPTSASGTFTSSTSGTTDAAFSITTTNSQGYELKIKSTSGTVLKPTTTTSDSDGLSTITTSGITSSSFTNNTWGYLPNYYNCNEASGTCTTNTTNYYPATTSDVTLRKTTSANTTAHNYTIGLGAKADLTKASGTYTLGGNKGSLVLTYVANPTAYEIAYDKGKAANDPGNMPDTQSGSVSATSVTLSSNIPTLTGYTFTGWCLGEVNRSSAEVDSCTGTDAKTFAAGASFGIDRTSTNSVTLHAMWSKAPVNVTVNFAGSGVTGVTFTNTTYGNVTVSASGNTAALKYGVQYDITGTYSSGYEFSSWATTAGSLGSTSSASTTYSTTTAATLTLTGKASCAPVGSLYCTIASMNKGKQTNDTNATTGIQAKITAPTSTDRTQDTSNSGVYEYDASLFGVSSDASNDYKIYYYRGILEPEADQGSYGSDGKATTYPNYVKLSNDTCWRILRTTGSGGVKLIYNGTYGATTSGSCANAQTNAQLTTKAFDATANGQGKSIVGVGYTYNASYKSATDTTEAGILFGTNDSYSGNTSPSTMKTYIEDTWYKSNMEAYTSKLEPSAGYCNDRSVNTGTSWTSYSDSTSITTPYSTSISGNTAFYFGARMRNGSTYQIPSLTCPRNVVDLFTTSIASNGNKQLGYPAALATADEMSFAGSGSSTASNGSSYNAKSFAGSGSQFWLLSPSIRDSIGFVYGYALASYGRLIGDYVSLSYGVRPVVSLTSGMTPASGSGTATDPWVITLPPTMQSIAVSDLAEGQEITAMDARDGKDYTIKKINGYLWMTQNLRFTGTSLDTTNSNVTSDKTLTYYSLDSSDDGGFGAYSGHCDSTNGYNYACIYDSGSTTTGVWYNYYAASAGTISTNSNDTAASEDICPKNWHLPTGPSTTSGTDFNVLVGNTTSGRQDPTTGLTAFSAVAGGSYINGSLGGTGSGCWWPAAASSTTFRYRLLYNSSDGQFSGDSSSRRYSGSYVRCVMTPPTMQSIAVSDLVEGEEITAVDARDGKDYTIKKINGYLWMTQNLRYLGDTGSASGKMTIGNSNSNVTNKSIDLYSLNSSNAGNFGAYSGHCDSTNGYNYACVYDSGSTTTGVWYNYYAASAGTITGSSNNTAATKDICPAGWHLPTGPNTTSGTDINKLVGNTTLGWQAATTGLTAFSAVAGGYYLSGSLDYTGNGFWWSATAYNTTDRYRLSYNSSNGQFSGNYGSKRYVGYYVRCVRTS